MGLSSSQHLKVNTEGLSRLQITKTICDKVESDLENSVDKKTLLQELSHWKLRLVLTKQRLKYLKLLVVTTTKMPCLSLTSQGK